MKRIMITAMSVMLAALAFGQAVHVYKGGGEVRLSPRLLNYQGYLTDTLGNPVTNPSVSMTFAILDAISAGNQKWTETQTSVDVNKGVFSVLLGSITPIPDSVFNNADRWLELAIGALKLLPRTRIVSSAYAYTSTYSDTAQYSRNSVPDNDWAFLISDGADTTLQTGGRWGIARNGNELYGTADSTHVNLGVGSITGSSGQNHKYCTVSGGIGNSAQDMASTVCGGLYNVADFYSVVAGGYSNRAIGPASAVVGGFINYASGDYSWVGGGSADTAKAHFGGIGSGYSNLAGNELTDTAATVCGGWNNSAIAKYAFVGGGSANLASNAYATVCGGYADTASDWYSCVCGGSNNVARDNYSFVAGGEDNDASGSHSFCANYSSYVSGMGSAAFNGATVTEPSTLGCINLQYSFGYFSIDHPLNPETKILNQYTVGSSEPVLSYRGTAIIGSDGTVIVLLPDYFDALNANPMVQLTGVGSPDVVYVAEDVTGNRFIIGGKPGMKVYWTVTGERKDMTGQIRRLLTPVEQMKTGPLKGRSLDDITLANTMRQLTAMGKADGFEFRTNAGRERYDNIYKMLEGMENK